MSGGDAYRREHPALLATAHGVCRHDSVDFRFQSSPEGQNLPTPMPMHENQSQTESLLDIVRSITNETLLLPEFQRDFRWEMDQTYDLFDSLIREIFIGTIIYGKPGFGMTLRQIDDRPRKGKGSRRPAEMRHYDKDEIVNKSQTQNLRIILDGQQRITSIYRCTDRDGHVYIVLRDDLKPEELIERAAGADPRGGRGVRRARRPSPFDSPTPTAPRRRAWKTRNSTQLFASRLSAWRLSRGRPRRKPFAKAYRRTVKKLCDLYKKQKLVAFHLLDMTLDKFCLFFERSNSRGIQLNFTDILAAKLYHGFNLRQKIDEFESQHNLRLNRETIVRTVAYLTAWRRGGRSASTRRPSWRTWTPEDFHRHWDRACGFYKLSLDYLVNQHFVLNRDWLPSENMVIPLMVFLSHVKAFDRIDEDAAEVSGVLVLVVRIREPIQHLIERGDHLG